MADDARMHAVEMPKFGAVPMQHGEFGHRINGSIMMTSLRLPITCLLLVCLYVDGLTQHATAEGTQARWRFNLSTGLTFPSLGERIAEDMDGSGFGDSDQDFGLLFFIPLGSSTDYPQKSGVSGFIEVGVDYRVTPKGWLGCRLGLDPSAGASGFNKVGSSSTGSLFFPLLYSSTDHGHHVYREHSTKYIALTYTHAYLERVDLSIGPTLDFNSTVNGTSGHTETTNRTSVGLRLGLAIHLNSWFGIVADWRWRQSATFGKISEEFQNEAGQTRTSYLPEATFPMQYVRIGLQFRVSKSRYAK